MAPYFGKFWDKTIGTSYYLSPYLSSKKPWTNSYSKKFAYLSFFNISYWITTKILLELTLVYFLLYKLDFREKQNVVVIKCFYSCNLVSLVFLLTEKISQEDSLWMMSSGFAFELMKRGIPCYVDFSWAESVLRGSPCCGYCNVVWIK